MKGKIYTNKYGIKFKVIQVFQDGDILLKSISDPAHTITINKGELNDFFK
jgi:hypothetical protein